ncbi:hypothetical protein [Serratia proteamaculans]|uniref:Uncharacterized protein n=1 Tax=Serratia proteamaculans TaxID=28151 RepID=A0A5Q2VHL9_SERPR|nr:hypothetical protein [Serratia proteamaculans]QGH63696.1 hypothetical protein GHV41_23815 [Serratia proteamaculans]
MKSPFPLNTMLAICLATNTAYAEYTPNLVVGAGGIYKVEDFLPEKNSWTISSGVSIYENSKSSTLPQYTLNLTSLGSFFLDNSVSIVNTKTKQLTGYTSLQYGVTDNLSLRGIWIGKYSRKDTTDEQLSLSTETKGNADSYNLGMSYRLEDFYPLTVLGTSIGFKSGSLSNYTLSSSFSWVLDPVVLTLYPSYIDGVSSKKDDIKYRYLSTTGILSIALNNDVDVKFGASKDIYTTKEKNPHSPSWDTSSSLITGITFNSWENFTVDFTIDHELGGVSANTFSLDLSWRV